MNAPEPRAIAQRFAPRGAAVRVEPFAGGHINRSYLVTIEQRGRRDRLLLQRINDVVFPRPELVVENVERVVDHLAAADGAEDPLVPRLARADDGARHVRDADGGWWRAFEFVEGTVTRQWPESPAEARDAARMIGLFQRRLATLPGGRLHAPIPGFHDTPARLAAFEGAVARDPAGRAAEARREIEAVERHAPLAGALVDAQRRGALTERVVHNDAKIANVLFDARSGAAVRVVDLDTVMPGLGPYDFGDMVRSMASDAAEDERDLDRVVARPEIVEALARGYLEGTGPLSSAAERGLLLTAAKVITYEQAVRFLADHLEGDRYYRIERPGQNLDRARTQLALLTSLEGQQEQLEARIGSQA